jgi:hypothetical protein
MAYNKQMQRTQQSWAAGAGRYALKKDYRIAKLYVICQLEES